jgi:putative methionine-R-sulfoxide reductase with GAF domain
VLARAIALSNDVARDPRYLTNQDDSGSELIVPIMMAASVVGTLDVESDVTGAFGAEVILQYETLARALPPLWDDSGSADTRAARPPYWSPTE